MIKMNVQTFIIFIVLTYANGQDRQITPIPNYGCKTCTDENPFLYINATGSHDTIHQIWDFTRGVPTVIYMIASSNSSLNITWEGTRPSKFELSEVPIYSFAAAINEIDAPYALKWNSRGLVSAVIDDAVIRRVWGSHDFEQRQLGAAGTEKPGRMLIYEYDDLEDNGYISPKCPQQHFSLRHLSWHWNRNTSVLTDKEAMLIVRARYRDGRRSGTIDIKLDLLPFKDYAVSLPHLIHTANSSLIDIRLMNLTSAKEYNATRFALNLLVVSTDHRSDSWNYTMRKSLDDEHTPGVFEIVEIKSPKSIQSGDGGFLQFRPVAYTDAERDVSSSTNTHISKLNRTWLPPQSTLIEFYRGYNNYELLAQNMLISFGLGGDGFYKQHNYTAWSFTLGYGAPPTETFSLFVIVIISIGLGVPVLLAVSGIAYVLLRRYRQRNPPTRLTDDDDD